MSTNPGVLLPTDEYERRKTFLEGLKTLTRAEHIEIIRILQKHDAQISENHNGVFFNVGLLSQDVFDALELFLKFTHSNRHTLADREKIMTELSSGKNCDAVA